MTIGSCLSRSTAHGLMNIGNEQYVYGKLLWIVLTTMTLSCFVYHTYCLYDQLLEEHVLVSTLSNYLPFVQPDIVFCPERFLARDFINHPPDSEYDFMLNVSKNIEKFDKLYRASENKSSSKIWDSLSSYEIYRAFFHRKHQLILTIKCNFQDVSLDDLVPEMNFVHFACYRLKASSCSLKSPFDMLIVKFYTHIHGVNVTYSKLNVEIENKTIDSYLFAEREPNDEMEDGMHIYFVNENEGISEGTTKTTASVNEHTSIKIKSTEYIRLSTKKSPCAKEKSYDLIYNLLEENIEMNPQNVSRDSLCIEMAFQKFMYKLANCVMKRFPIPISISSHFQFCENLFNSSNSEAINSWRQHDHMESIIQDCSKNVSCKTRQFTVVANYNKWPRTLILRNIFKNDIVKKVKELKKSNLSSPGLEEALEDFQNNPSKVENWKRNFIKVSISPAEFTSTIVEESLAYSFKNFFSDIGGIMGFYMGASILTLCEILRLVHCIILIIFQLTRKKERKMDADFPIDNFD